MTREEKIALILAAIQDDAKLIKLMRALVSGNIQNVPDERLDAALLVLSG